MSQMTAEERQRRYFDQVENQFPEASALEPHVQEELTQVANRLSFLPQNSLILDFGAGNGRLTKTLLAAGYRVLAVDISEVSLRALRKAALKLGVLHRVKTATFIPEGQRICAIAGCDILHHVARDETVAQFAQLLSQKERGVFSEPNSFNPAWYFFLTLCRPRSWAVELGLFACNPIGIRRLFERHGFTVKIDGLGLIPPPFLKPFPRLSRLNYWLGHSKLLRLFAYRMIITVTKT